MKILARWSVMLTMALTVGFSAVETKVEAASDSANNSQEKFNKKSESNQQEKQTTSTTSTTKVEPTSTVKIEPASTSRIQPIGLSTPTNSPIDDKKLVKKTALVSKRSAVRSFRATAYCLKGRTATGGSVRRGIVAADRRVLPLGTKVYIEAGAYSGMYTVSDTGGAVKGNILDIWVPSCSEANRFGRRSIGVSVVGN